jgi:Zn-dependent oligopeptidase
MDQTDLCVETFTACPAPRNPMNSEQTFKYRDTILARGGTKDAADLVTEFLGRTFTFKTVEDYLTRDAMQRRSSGMRRSAWAS